MRGLIPITSVRNLTRGGTFVFLTDSAVYPRGRQPPASASSTWEKTCPVQGRTLPHLQAFDGVCPRVRGPRPATTASRRSSVLGVTRVSVPRVALTCVATAGGNQASRAGSRARRMGHPHADALRKSTILLHERAHAEFYPDADRVAPQPRPCRTIPGRRRRRACRSTGSSASFLPSANARTLAALREFLPVPVDELTREFAGGDSRPTSAHAHPRTSHDAGVRHSISAPAPRRAAVTRSGFSRHRER